MEVNDHMEAALPGGVGDLSYRSEIFKVVDTSRGLKGFPDEHQADDVEH